MHFLNIVYLFICALSVNLYGHKPLSSIERREIAQDILSTPIENLVPEQIDNIAKTFTEENEYTSKWFETHGESLKPFLQQIAEDTEIKIMGSRRWNTTHILSDIDAVVVTESSDHEKIVDVLQNYYAAQYPHVEQFRTKTRAGLYLFILKNFADPKLGEMKLEYTIQSPETNKTIIEGMMERISSRFTDVAQKIRYSIAMMAAVYNNDTQAQLSLKEWTRVLPVKQ